MKNVSLDEYVCDKNKDAEKREARLYQISQSDLQRAFDLTLHLYRTIQTRGLFKGYNKECHMRQNTEFLFFRDSLRQIVYKYYLTNPKDCIAKLEELRGEKNLKDAIKNEVTDICKSLTDAEAIRCFDIPIDCLIAVDFEERRKGISFNKLIGKALVNYFYVDGWDTVKLFSYLRKSMGKKKEKPIKRNTVAYAKQLINVLLDQLDFECVSHLSSPYKQIYVKDNLTVRVEEKQLWTVGDGE